MSLNPNPDNFVTECPIKTRSRTYTLDWTDGNITIFKSPDGFQYDRYFDAMFPIILFNFSIQEIKIMQLIEP